MAKADLITDNVWKAVTSEAKKARNPAYVAVAYFGKGASKLLPLPPRSRLVVDASERAVSAGLTCPADLRKEQNRGAVVFSIPNLHAKVYAFDKSVVIGSANVSSHSAHDLIEAVVQTDDRTIVRESRKFVRGLCLSELTPSALDRLQKIYRPPRMTGKQKHHRRRNAVPELPQLYLVQLETGTPPRESRQTSKAGMQEAKERKRHRDYVCDYFWWEGDVPRQKGEKIVQVTQVGPRKRLVSPPAEIIHLRRWRRARQQITFLYFEHPKMRRVHLESLARRIGYGARKKLLRSGLVRNAAFKEKLLAAFGI